MVKLSKLPFPARLGVEINTSLVSSSKVRALYKKRPEFTGSLMYLWAAYVRATIRASDVAFVLDSAEMERNWIIWEKAEKKRFMREFIAWLGLVRKSFRESVAFLLNPQFIPERRKHWPPARETREGCRKLSLRRGRDESFFLPGIRPNDIEELYYACAKYQLSSWFNSCPDKVWIDCGHTVGFCEGKETPYIRIQIGDLSSIHGLPDDGRDRGDDWIISMDELPSPDLAWRVSFRERCL